MKHLKSICLVIIAVIILFGLNACKRDTPNKEKEVTTNTTQQPAPVTTTPAPTNTPPVDASTENKKAERIDFEKEKSNALVWEEKVAGNTTKEFVFYAKKGQKLTLGFIDDTKQGSMDLGKVSIEPNTDYKSVIEESKDYRLSVSNNINKPTSFRISISLE